MAAAQLEMGKLLQSGIGVEANGEWAAYWLEKAAEQDLSPSLSALFDSPFRWLYGFMDSY